MLSTAQHSDALVLRLTAVTRVAVAVEHFRRQAISRTSSRNDSDLSKSVMSI